MPPNAHAFLTRRVGIRPGTSTAFYCYDDALRTSDAPTDIADQVIGELDRDQTVANVTTIRGVVDGGSADLIMFEVARENANAITVMLQRLDVPRAGSVIISEPVAVMSDAADRAEGAAPGHPGDGVVLAQLEDRSRDDARPSWTFYVFLLLATLIAGVGRYLDQPILIIGAMVVGPEFAPIAAICFALSRGRGLLPGRACFTLLSGLAVAAVISYLLWGGANLAGLIDFDQATSGPLTEFIVNPDIWSFIVALLAGIAGVLSMTSAKSSALVGVFISITTVPAVAAISLTAAVGAWEETAASAAQLAINVGGIVIAGTVTLFIQLRVTPPVSRRLARRRDDHEGVSRVRR